jgi:hypothetical protein
MLLLDEATLGEQCVSVLFGPPIMGSLVWLLARALSPGEHGEKLSKKARERQRRQFYMVLIVMYLVAMVAAAYSWVV